MRKVFSYFPSGTAGAGLVLLRLSIAEWLLLTAFQEDYLFWPRTGMIVTALALATGLQCRFFSAVAAVLAMESIYNNFNDLPVSSSVILSALALALVGPGAFSIDARLFGRRTVVLLDKSRSVRS